ncbi:MAG: Holliday junction branch migration protein RuvA [Alphaproteobacteria bacterium]
MIGKLSGNIDQVNDDHCIIDVNGVGYVVHISQKTASYIRQYPANNKISLVIETRVKEDAIELFGFANAIEKIWFMELLKVQGVGAKMAQKILSALNIDELAKALVANDTKTFSKISGIGPKLASRLTTELKNSPQKLGIDLGDFEISNIANQTSSLSQIMQDALSALENLGYKKHDCLKVLDFFTAQDQDITLENLITTSLRELAKKR